MQGKCKAPGVTRNAIEIKGQLGEESRLEIHHAMGSGMPVLLWMYKSRGDNGAREGEFQPGGPPHIPGRGGGQGRKTQEDQGDHKGIQGGPGVDIHLVWTGQKLCPVVAMLACLVKRREGPGPLQV